MPQYLSSPPKQILTKREFAQIFTSLSTCDLKYELPSPSGPHFPSFLKSEIHIPTLVANSKTSSDPPQNPGLPHISCSHGKN